MHELQTELERRWQSMFATLAGGDDVPPSQRLRAEGMMEAAVLLGSTPAGLVECMDRCYRAAFGRGIDEEFGADWQEFFPFPQIPAMAQRAPVYPSTRE
jgi:hypothetical protein